MKRIPECAGMKTFSVSPVRFLKLLRQSRRESKNDETKKTANHDKAAVGAKRIARAA